MKSYFLPSALIALFAALVGCAESQSTATTPVVTQKVRRPSNELRIYSIQLEVRRGQSVDYRISSDIGRGFAAQRVPCDAQKCVFTARVGGHTLHFQVRSGQRLPEISHESYEVRLNECRQDFAEVGADVITCTFSF
jgi:hypothetical protein